MARGVFWSFFPVWSFKTNSFFFALLLLILEKQFKFYRNPQSNKYPKQLRSPLVRTRILRDPQVQTVIFLHWYFLSKLKHDHHHSFSSGIKIRLRMGASSVRNYLTDLLELILCFLLTDFSYKIYSVWKCCFLQCVCKLCETYPHRAAVILQKTLYFTLFREVFFKYIVVTPKHQNTKMTTFCVFFLGVHRFVCVWWVSDLWFGFCLCALEWEQI